MLDRNELDKYGPPGFHLSQKEKDYAQHWMLSFLSREGFGGVFKGGTCLQKAFGLPRYSEDLDFSLGEAGLPDFDSLAAFLSSAGFSGVSWKSFESSASNSVKLRFKGPLYNGSPLSEGTVTLDFSQREKILLKPVPAAVRPPYPDLLPYQISSMQKHEIAAEKIRALSTRTSGRDLYDLYFLFRQNAAPDRQLADAKLAFYGKSFDPKTVEKNIRKIKSIYDREMNAFTPAPVDYESVAAEVLKRLKKLGK